MQCIDVGLFVAPSVVFAQDSTPKMDSGSMKMMKTGDMPFATKAAQGGLAEVQLGKLASEKGSDPDVKAFGQQMVDDHSKANDQLKSVAEKDGMTLPTSPNAKQQMMYTKLQALSGAAFDKAYVADMVKDHEEDVKEFQKEGKLGQERRHQVVRGADPSGNTRSLIEDQVDSSEDGQRFVDVM